MTLKLVSRNVHMMKATINESDSRGTAREEMETFTVDEGLLSKFRTPYDVLMQTVQKKMLKVVGRHPGRR